MMVLLILPLRYHIKSDAVTVVFLIISFEYDAYYINIMFIIILRAKIRNV